MNNRRHCSKMRRVHLGFGKAALFLLLNCMIAVVVVTPCVADTKPTVPVVTVCDLLRDSSVYNGSTVAVVGRYGGTDEGVWLDADCPQKLVQNGIEWHASIALADMMAQSAPPSVPKGFDWNKRLLREKVAELKPSTHLHAIPEYHYRDQWAAAFGRFETRPLRSKTDGYGHLGGSPARLVCPEKGVRIVHLPSEHWVVSKP
jgi:hypothetical protein